MDASQYKDYVLTLLFVKYVSDKYAGQPDAQIVVPKGGGFADLVKLKNKKEIGDGINKVIAKLAEENGLKGVIDQADFNDENKLGKGKEMQDRLTNLVGIFENPALDFSSNRAGGDDLLGDAYEYLMRFFATQSGKSKGQFYTPAEPATVMALVIGISQAKRQDQSIYDPTGGSGSLVLKAADQAPHGITIYIQEIDNATAALAKMNMILHGQPTAEVWQDNTLSNPHFKNPDGSLKTFDFVVANFPFSMKSWRNGFDPEHDVYGRFDGFGVPPDKNGDYAFLLHIIKSMKSNGKGAVILPHGVLFRGNAEGEIRKNLIQRGYIKGIIGLPANLFYGTGIPACIIVLDKENAAARKGIFMIDASKGFMKDGNKNRLRHQDIHRIVDVFNRQLEIPKYARMVSVAEIADAKNDYNLNIPRYIDSSEPEDIQDIEAHLRGDIPNRDLDDLGKYWQVYPSLRRELFGASARAGYSKVETRVKTQHIASLRETIYAHPEFVSFTQRVNQVFADWRAKNVPGLKKLKIGSKPKVVIRDLSEDILQAFADVQLIDRYDVYQHLMTYWTEAMQDDVYMIAVDGWQANVELIPPALVIQRYFATERQAIEQLQADKDAVTRQREELEEEHTGDVETQNIASLDLARNEKDKLTKASVQARLKEILADADAADETQVCKTWLDLMEREAKAGKAIRDAQAALDEKVAAKYKTLSVDEVKQLVVNDKWMATIENAIQVETQNLASQLIQRIKELSERYAAPLPQLDADVETLTAKVEAHLHKMGHQWN
jgi:type I restriction enzyme M protein